MLKVVIVQKHNYYFCNCCTSVSNTLSSLLSLLSSCSEELLVCYCNGFLFGIYVSTCIILVKAGGKTESVYNGRSTIAVTESTPFCMNYAMKTQRVTVTFYIQRYTAEDFVLDLSLQAQMNG